jgi:hypothetical protein
MYPVILRWNTLHKTRKQAICKRQINKSKTAYIYSVILKWKTLAYSSWLVGCGLADWSEGDREPKQFLERKLNKFSK